uniref:Uncharacterized protein n=1 Tax=Glossina palpalis gambiensis TaxID=67801 RepID=A0A1B0AU75_9MUSC
GVLSYSSLIAVRRSPKLIGTVFLARNRDFSPTHSWFNVRSRKHCSSSITFDITPNFKKTNYDTFKDFMSLVVSNFDYNYIDGTWLMIFITFSDTIFASFPVKSDSIKLGYLVWFNILLIRDRNIK